MKLTCNYCHEEFIYKVNLDNSTVSICCVPACPAYGLLQIPTEKMPGAKKKLINKRRLNESTKVRIQPRNN